ncbi:MAG TPA: four helix bundle protein, partial [Minicystis sp.]|nr:four helix bundle protein [Minicystis sp.]
EPRRAQDGVERRWSPIAGARHGSFAGGGMQRHPTFLALELSVLAIERLAPLVLVIRRFDRDLADQIRRAASSVALNLAEGNRSDAGNRRARFCTASGSNAEVRAALRVAVAWGYVGTEQVAPVDALFDRVGGMLLLYRLGARC